MHFYRLRFIILLLMSPFVWTTEETRTITSWNIENLGTGHRGFSWGYGQGKKGPRSETQLKAIANFIKNDLRTDLLAFQEVAISRIENGRAVSDALDIMVAELGEGWQYYLPATEPIPDVSWANQFCGFLWNGNRIRASGLFVMPVSQMMLEGIPIFVRKPVIGHFSVIHEGKTTNDFTLVNLHLKSGQNNEENHMIAVTWIEASLTSALCEQGILEEDRVFLGDFNDNPYATWRDGSRKYSDALYHHMTFKGYTNLVTQDSHSTRMDFRLTSIIDHVLVNWGMIDQLTEVQADLYLPGNASPQAFADWRDTYSDHFPISFIIQAQTEDDDVNFQVELE